jgi:aspartyl-tRNA synthetase
MTRHRITKATRDYFDKNGFIEIETPVLIKSTPEGARDYLVPSRVHGGSFYALPQSPQLYKQLLMVSGFDRYMQIAKCFRDEDLRADRQPEFTQIDLEMSYVDENDIIAMTSGFIQYLFKTVLDADIELPMQRMSYAEAMERFGSDKPDVRFGMELVDLSNTVRDGGFGVFDGAVERGGSVRAINAKGLADKLSRKEIDKLVLFAKSHGAAGLAYTRITGDGEVSSSFEKFLSDDVKTKVRTEAGLENGDVMFVMADSDTVVFNVLGALRTELASRFDLYDKNSFAALWITNFPLFEQDEETGRLAAKHHPFTSPAVDDISQLEKNPINLTARAYDMVINGYEVGGGSIRINTPEVQSAMFKALGFSQEEANERFGFLLDAFKYGVPPHGGIAFGLDRLTMILTGTDNIRDVIAFPKIQNASEPMTSCPAPVDEKQLEELRLSVMRNE